jgi:AcrR family transcriptional regulator
MSGGCVERFPLLVQTVDIPRFCVIDYDIDIGCDMSTAAPTRQTEATRKAILRATSDLFLKRKFDGFSVQEVADRAGLTHRTVYRYFPTRQELMHATVEHLAPGMDDEPFSEVSTVEEWIDAVGAHLAFIEANFEVVRGLMVAALASDELLRSDQRLRDREAHRWEVFHHQFPHLAEGEARRTFAMLRHLTSPVSYVFLRLRFGMSPTEATEAIQSGASQMVDQAAIRNRFATHGRTSR